MVVAIIAAGAATVTILRSQLVGDLDDRLDERALVAHEFARGEPLDASAPPDVVAFRFLEFNTAVVLLGNGGEILVRAPSGSNAAPDPLPDLGGLDVGQLEAGEVERHDLEAANDVGPHYRALVTRIDPDTVLVLAAPLDSIIDTIKTALITLVIAGIVTAAALALLIWLVVRRSFRGLDEMVTTAGAIAEGDLTARAPLVNRRDEVGRLGYALNTMLDEVETATRARAGSQEQLRRFVADASHELRTPLLTTIRGYADLYRQGANSAEQTETAMARIEHETIRMTALVEDLLLLARLDQNRPLSTEAIDIASLVQDAVDAARAIEPSRPIEVELAGSGPFQTNGDAARLRQAVDNLLANVREHTTAETGAHVRVSTAEREVRVEVADEGPGMSENAASHAFERFYQAAGSSARTGTGLGLAITAAIVEAHEGRIDLDTRLGAGTMFTVTLPSSQ